MPPKRAATQEDNFKLLAWDQYASDNPELAQKYLAAAKRKIICGVDTFKSSPSPLRTVEPATESGSATTTVDGKGMRKGPSGESKKSGKWGYCTAM